MFGSARPVVFDPYRRQRARWRLPRWLVLLLLGFAAGVAAVLFVQQRYLPPRLTAEASAELRGAYELADADRKRARAELAETTTRLNAMQAGAKRLADELAAARATLETQRADIATLVTALPPDPRGGEVEVRAGRFSASGGQLSYDVVLTRGGSSARALDGVMQLVIAGSAGGRDSSFNAPPVALKLASHGVLHGSVKLPDGFQPRQATVQLLDRAGGRSFGMRVMLVK